MSEEKTETTETTSKNNTVKLGQLASSSFPSALSKLLKLDLPIKAQHDLAETVEKYDQEIKKYNTVRKNIISKWAKKDEKGNVASEKGQVLFEQENVPLFTAELNELNNIDVEFDKIDAHAFGSDLDNLKLNGYELSCLKTFIQFGKKTTN